jgi:hypothetical protein
VRQCPNGRRAGGRLEDVMGTKDKGAKNTKKKAAKSLKEKRLDKKAKSASHESTANRTVDKTFGR